MLDIKAASADELLERRSAIAQEIDAPEADLNALEEEARAINAELEARKAAAAAKKAVRDQVAAGAGKEIEKKEKTKMTREECLNSKEYVEAFARYIKTGKEAECRAILTENGYSAGEGDGGPVPVPTYIEGRIRTAWEKNGLAERIRKSYIRGNVTVGFEYYASGASYHAEGADAPDPEDLMLGAVKIVAGNIKKWVELSDEVVDTSGSEFLDYIYDELAQKITKTAEDMLIYLIATASTVASSTNVAVVELEADASDMLTIVAQAYAHLSDEAADPCIVMNKLTFAEFRKAQAAASFAQDPFEGLPIYYNNTLDTVGNTTGAAWLIVGDFGQGALANFPNGDQIKLTYDDISQAPRDMVRITGRMFGGFGLVANNAFVRVVGTT